MSGEHAHDDDAQPIEQREASRERRHHLLPEGRLMLLVGRPTMTSTEVAEAKEILRDGQRRLDWGEFFDLCARNRVLGLASRNFDRESLGPLGTVRRHTLRGAYLFNRQRNMALFREWQAIFRAFNATSAQPVVRKGAYLTHGAYADPAVRFMEDIDFYVAQDDLSVVSDCLRSLGYEQGSDSTDGRRIEPLARDVEVFWRLNVSAVPTFLRPTSDPYVDVFAVDLRRDLLERASDKSMRAEAFVARSRKVRFGEESAWVPSHEDMFIDIGVHLYREATTLSSIQAGKDLCVSRFVDVVCWEAHVRDKYKVDQVVSIAADNDLTRELYFALHFTDVLFPDRLPTSLLDALRPDNLDYLDEFGESDRASQVWSAPFLERLLDRRRMSTVTGQSSFPRTRKQWTDDAQG